MNKKGRVREDEQFAVVGMRSSLTGMLVRTEKSEEMDSRVERMPVKTLTKTAETQKHQG